MKTKREVKKKFDAVAFMRKRREEIDKEIKGMTTEEEVNYFKERANSLRKEKTTEK
jgi:hypothetical protein